MEEWRKQEEGMMYKIKEGDSDSAPGNQKETYGFLNEGDFYLNLGLPTK